MVVERADRKPEPVVTFPLRTHHRGEFYIHIVERSDFPTSEHYGKLDVRNRRGNVVGSTAIEKEKVQEMIFHSPAEVAVKLTPVGESLIPKHKKRREK